MISLALYDCYSKEPLVTSGSIWTPCSGRKQKGLLGIWTLDRYYSILHFEKRPVFLQWDSHCKALHFWCLNAQVFSLALHGQRRPAPLEHCCPTAQHQSCTTSWQGSVLWAVVNYPHRKDLTQGENASYSGYCGTAELEAEVLTAMHDEEDTESKPVIVLSPVSGHRD